MRIGYVTFPVSIDLLHRLLELDPSDRIETVGNYDDGTRTVELTVSTPNVPEGTWRSSPTVTEHRRRIEWDWNIVRAEGSRAGGVVGQPTAQEGFVTPRPGWERTCATCEGHGGQMHRHIVAVPGHAPGCMGQTCERTCPVRVRQLVDEWEACPDCVSGEVPSDELVDATTLAVFGDKVESLDDWHRVDRAAWTATTRAVLLAARKHEETARNTGVTP